METTITGTETVDKAFDALLKAGEGKKLTDEEAKNLSSIMEENLPDDAKLLRDIESGNIEFDRDGEDKIDAKVTIDPFSGKATKIDIDDTPDTMSLDAILDSGGIIGDIDPNHEIEYSETAVQNALKKVYNTNASDKEVSELTSLLIKATKGDRVKYNDLPVSIKTKIAQTIMAEKGSIYTGNLELKDQMAKVFMDSLIEEVMHEEINEIFVDLQDSISSIAKEGIDKAYNSSFAAQRNILENETIKIANDIEEKNPEKAQLLRDMNYAYRQSYTLEEMLNTYISTGKCKIKKYDIEKVSRVYEGFNSKYEKSKWVVRDISMLEPVLARRLSEDYTLTHIKAFLIVFCKYVLNMNPDESIKDHTFMYYFIMNILNLDAFDPENEEDAKFYNALISTIENFIDKIKEKAKL